MHLYDIRGQAAATDVLVLINLGLHGNLILIRFMVGALEFACVALLLVMF